MQILIQISMKRYYIYHCIWCFFRITAACNSVLVCFCLMFSRITACFYLSLYLMFFHVSACFYLSLYLMFFHVSACFYLSLYLMFFHVTACFYLSLYLMFFHVSACFYLSLYLMFFHVSACFYPSSLSCFSRVSRLWFLQPRRPFYSSFTLRYSARFCLPFILVYMSRYLSLNIIPHRQLVLYTGSTLKEEIMPKESWFFNLRVNVSKQWWAIMH